MQQGVKFKTSSKTHSDAQISLKNPKVVNATAESQDAVQLSGFDGDSSCALALIRSTFADAEDPFSFHDPSVALI